MVFKSLNEAAYSIIREKILHGGFELGSRIREDALAEEISISRTPVREAINRLVADGIIIKKAQRGLYLIDPDPEQIQDHIDIRISLEKLAVRKCIERATDEDIATISNSLAAFEKALQQKEELTKNASLTNKKLNLEKFKIVEIVNLDKKQKKTDLIQK